MATSRAHNAAVSLIVPVHDEEGSIAQLSERIARVMEERAQPYELIFVDDGSRDGTPSVLRSLRASDPRIRIIRLSRSFGHQAALCAGMKAATGQAAITLDGDLQHPPELIPEMLQAWEAGADVVNTVRRSSDAVSRLKEQSSRAFYRLMNVLATVPVLEGGADFRLLDRRALDAFNEFHEHFVFVRGLVPWMGFSSATVEYDPGNRRSGASKYDLRQMIRLGLNGVTSFSVAPLRLITLMGLGTTAVGVLYGLFALGAYLTGAHVEAGWTSLVVLILVFGGVQLLSLGIMSEYVGRMYEEVKGRPRYFIEHTEGFD